METKGSTLGRLLRRRTREPGRKDSELGKIEMDYPAKPVFIIGSPRSGTTVLGRILMMLGDHYFQPSTEAHFLYWFLEPTRRILESPEKFPGATNPIALANPENHALLRKSVADSVHHIYRTIGEETGTRNWVDKTPDVQQALFIPFLTQLFPESRVILIHRHPLEVFISTVKNWNIAEVERKRDILERWAKLQRFYRGQIVRSVPEERRHVIRQENLRIRPGETANRLLTFLDVPEIETEQQRLQRFLNNNEVNRTKDFAGKGYDLRERASPEDIEMTEEICGGEMQFWNYQL